MEGKASNRFSGVFLIDVANSLDPPGSVVVIEDACREC